jgi:flagellar basal body-associated protein FliL
MNKIISIIIVLSIAVMLLVVGTYIGLKIGDEATAEVINPNPEVVVYDPPVTVVTNETEQEKEKVDIEVIYEDYYTNCKHKIVNKNMEFGSTIEKIKEKTDDEYDVIEEGDNGITFRKEIETNCPNHFELKLVDGYVVIFQRVTLDKTVIYKNTEIPQTVIRDELVEELEKGIKVDSLEDLNSYMEDIES